MTVNRTRLAGWALLIGAIVATAGYLAAGTLVHGHGDARFTSALWTPLTGIAIAGAIITALGLPVILTYHGRLAPRLTLVGYVGMFATIVMLNISEGCIEAFVKPYLATHGGVPKNPPPGLAVFENIALVCLVVGLICLGIAVIRARVFPRWTGALFIASPIAGFLPLPGPFAMLSDYLAFIAIITIGLQVVRTESRRPEPTPALAHSAPATP
ncbi:MAG: hypothetical protein ACR2FU_19885 [Streptosporangiaceae bacterium]